MAKNFIHEDFFRETDYGKELYRTYSKNKNIIDYHRYLPGEETSNKQKNFKKTNFGLKATISNSRSCAP